MSGTTSSPRPSTQAIATCATLALLASAISRSDSTSERLWGRFSPWKRGLIVRLAIDDEIAATVGALAGWPPAAGGGATATRDVEDPETLVFSAPMPLADEFQAAVDSLPPDWTQLELDLRIFDEERYVEAATLLSQINAMPYSQHDWHWRLRVAHEFGHAAAAETVRGTLALLDDQGIDGELAVREARSGRVEVTQMWGRPESVRQEFRRRRAQ
jgi:hypothetical protein